MRVVGARSGHGDIRCKGRNPSIIPPGIIASADSSCICTCMILEPFLRYLVRSLRACRSSAPSPLHAHCGAQVAIAFLSHFWSPVMVNAFARLWRLAYGLSSHPLSCSAPAGVECRKVIGFKFQSPHIQDTGTWCATIVNHLRDGALCFFHAWLFGWPIIRK